MHIDFFTKKIVQTILLVVFFFSIFDAYRLYLPIPSWVGYLKEVCVILAFVLFALIKLPSVELARLPQTSFLIFVIFLLFFSSLFTSYWRDIYSVQYFIYFYKYLQIVFLYGIFSIAFNFKIFDSRSVYKLYVNTAFIYLLIQSVSYIFLRDSFVGLDLYQGRLSIGQPAITTFPYLASLIILFFRSDIFSRERFLIYTLFFVFALLLAVSSTGLVCLATIFLYAIYSNFKRNSVPLSVIFLMVGLALVFSDTWFQNIIDVDLYTQKINAMAYDLESDPSYQIRVNKIKLATSYSLDYILTGVGIMGYVVPHGAPDFVENQIVTFLLSFGIIGLLVAIYVTFKTFILSRKSRSPLFYYCFFTVFAICSWSLETLYIFMYVVPLSFVFANLNCELSCNRNKPIENAQ